MEHMYRPLLTAGAIAITTILWAFFFSILGIDLDFFLSMNMGKIISTALSVQALLFVISFSLPYAAAAGMSLSGNKVFDAGASLLGSAFGIGIAYFFFPAFASFFYLLPFYVLSVALASFTAKATDQIGRFSRLKAINGGVQAGLLLLTLGIFVVVFYTVSQDPKGYLEKFEDGFAGNLSSGIEKGVEADPQQKTSFLAAFMNTPAYLNMVF